MTLPNVVKGSITVGDLKLTLKKIKERKQAYIVADQVARHITIISNYLKEVKGIQEPTIDDILAFLDKAPDDLVLHSLNVPVGRPCFETATCIGFKWLYGYVVKPLQDKGWPVIDLAKDKAIRKDLFGVIKSGAPYIKWLGHGNQSVITGQNFDYITWVGDYTGGNAFRQAGVKVFSALSCETAAALGPWLVKEKYIDAYYGYEETFEFAGGSEAVERPFFDSDTAFDRTLFSGEVTGEAYQAAIDTFDKYLKDPNTPEYIKPYLLHDRKGARLIGAKDVAPFKGQPPSPPPPPPPPPQPKKKFTFNFSFTSTSKGLAKGYAYIGRFKIPIELSVVLKGTGEGKGEGKEEEESK